MSYIVNDLIQLSIGFVFFLFFASTAVAQEGAGSLSDEKEIFAEIEKLKKQVKILQRQLEGQESSEGTDAVDLSGEEIPSILEAESSAHMLARPWFQNIDISGFGAVSFLDSGASGTRPNGDFTIKDTALFVEAEAWEDMSFFFEVQTNLLLLDHKVPVRTGEVYVHLRNVLKKWGDDLLGIKVGRIDIPFGEEYLWNDSSDNPLISHTAAYPWLWDEGIVLYGNFREVGWVASVTDGAIARGIDDDRDKAVTTKVYGTPWKPLYLSASFMRNGDTAKSALLLGGSFFQPVGAGDVPSVEKSPSEKVDTILYEIDAKYNFFDWADLELSFGQAFVDDPDYSFDRDLTWFSVQPRYNPTKKIYIVLRYSEIGTYNADEGYHLGGEFLAGGNEAFGYDAKRLQRFSLGLGWKPNPRTAIKLEVGRDQFEVIDTSPLNPSEDDRDFFGLEVAQSF